MCGVREMCVRGEGDVCAGSGRCVCGVREMCVRGQGDVCAG